MINDVKWVNSEEHINALDATASLCKSYFNSYPPVIVVDTFSPSKLKYFISHFEKEVKYLVVSLYCQDEILTERIMNRKTGYKEIDNCLILNREVGKYRHENELFIDTSLMDAVNVFDFTVKRL